VGSFTMAGAVPVATHRIERDAVTFSRNRRGERVQLGRGTFGDVFSAEYAGQQVAVKVLRVDGAGALPPSAVDAFWREVGLHYTLRHKHIVTVHGAYVDEHDTPHEYGLVLERMGSTLHDALYSSAAGGAGSAAGGGAVPGRLAMRPTFPLEKMLEVLVQVAGALRYLHSRHIVHTDLKPRNVLLDDRGDAKVSDFGLSHVRHDTSATRPSLLGRQGTPLYMAPELMSGAGSVAKPADMYSFGIMAWEVLARARPFAGLSVAEMYARVPAGERPDLGALPADLPEPQRADLASLLQACWHATPATRCTADDAERSLQAALDALRLQAANAAAQVEAARLSLQRIRDEAVEAQRQLAVKAAQLQGVTAALQERLVATEAAARALAGRPLVLPSGPTERSAEAVARSVADAIVENSRRVVAAGDQLAAAGQAWNLLYTLALTTLADGSALARTRAEQVLGDAPAVRELATAATVASTEAAAAAGGTARVDDRELARHLARATACGDLDAVRALLALKPLPPAAALSVPLQLAQLLGHEDILALLEPLRVATSAGGTTAVGAAGGVVTADGPDGLQEPAQRLVEQVSHAARRPERPQVGEQACTELSRWAEVDAAHAAALAQCGATNAVSQLLLSQYKAVGTIVAGWRALGALVGSARSAAAHQHGLSIPPLLQVHAVHVMLPHYERDAGMRAFIMAALDRCNAPTTAAAVWASLREAVMSGDAEAQCAMARCYHNGWGVAVNAEEAVAWYQRASEQGHASAQANLGVCYGTGFGVTMDLVEAVTLFRRAAEQGNAIAEYYLGTAYLEGLGAAKDPAEAVVWFRRAAEQGEVNAQYNLGLCYQTGEGVAKDAEQAVAWLRGAAELGAASAQFNLGVCYEMGEGVAKDAAQAVEWYRRAAEQGDADAQYNLGVRYEAGDGVANDVAKAVEWYRQSAEQGDVQARAALRRLGHA
jgi:TPR repeat protein